MCEGNTGAIVNALVYTISKKSKKGAPMNVMFSNGMGIDVAHRYVAMII